MKVTTNELLCYREFFFNTIIAFCGILVSYVPFASFFSNFLTLTF